MRIPLLALALALVLAAPLSAQPATTPAVPIAPSHLAAAKEYLDLYGIVDMALSGVQLAMDQQIAANPALEPFRATMIEWARGLFGSEEAKTAFASIYAEVFTEAEIRQLMVFARTPVGRKVVANQANLARRGAEVGQRLAQAHQADLMARLEALEAAPKPE
jgi:uncharacterized protein